MTILCAWMANARKLHSLWWRCTTRIIVAMQGVDLAPRVRFLGLPIITMEPGARITIGEQSLLCSVSSHTALGVMHPTILRALSPDATITIGKHVGISGASICAARSITIGNNVLIGANTVITDTDFHPITPENRRYEKDFKNIGTRPVVIEDNVFIGTGSMILKGSHIGRDSVVGAGSVVTGTFPQRVIIAGNPAKVIRKI